MILKNINLLLSAVIFAVTIFAFGGFIYLNKDNPLTKETKRLINKTLPETSLLESKTKKDFYNEVVKDEVIIVYLISTCDACKKELDIITESNLEEAKIFGIMSENKDIIRN